MFNLFKKGETLWYVLAGVLILGGIVGFGLWSKDQGSAIIVIAPPGTQIFVNGELEGQTGSWKREVVVKKGAGEYAIIASREGSWPWMKNISLDLNEKESLEPFLIPRDVKKEQIFTVIPGGDSGGTGGKSTTPNPKYKEVLEYLNEAALFIPNIPGEIAPLLPPLMIEDVKIADFYPGRRDVLIIAAENQVFVIETGEGTPRNFQPLYTGAEPIFAVKRQILYIKDGDLLYTIDLAAL